MVDRKKNFDSQKIGSFNVGHSFYSGDLIPIYIASEVIVARVRTVSALRERFSAHRDIVDFIEPVLEHMESQGLISIELDQITPHVDYLVEDGDMDVLREFLPRIFSVNVERAFKSRKDIAKGKKDESQKGGAIFYMLPNTEKVRKELRAILIETQSKMDNLVSRSEADEENCGTRFVGFVSAPMDPEDAQS